MAVGNSVGGIASRKDFLFLACVMSLYAAFTAFISYLKYRNFYTFNWDLGIAMQALWSTAHGHLMFETGDYLTLGVGSYLSVNSAFIAIPLSWLYAVHPHPVTLFTLQSIAVALSALPLFLIAISWVGNRTHVYLLVLMYLFSLGMLSGLLYDFHWEAFVPLEYLSFYYLLWRGRTALSLIPFAAGALTLQVFPPLAGAVVLFFLVQTLSAGRGSPAETGWVDRKWIRTLFLYALLIVAVYVAVGAAQSYITKVLSPGALLLNFAGGGVVLFPLKLDLGLSGVYWLLLLASAGFLPLFSPRHLILSIPWFVESVFLFSKFSSFFGAQYALIAFPPLFVAAVAGISRIKDRAGSRLLLLVPALFAALGLTLLFTRLSRAFLDPSGFLQLVLISAAAVPCVFAVLYASSFSLRYALRERPRFARPRGGPAVPVRSVVTATIVAVLFLNLVLSPLNTVNFEATQFPGYAVRYGDNPSFHYVSMVTASIKQGSTVLASSNLMPYVANDPEAYSLRQPYTPESAPYLPFTPSNLPDFVFADSAEIGSMPSFVLRALFNSSDYGLLSYIFQPLYPGTIYLFEKGYAGATGHYTSVPAPGTYYFSYRNLTLGSSGRIVRDASSRFGYIIESTNGLAAAPANVNNRAIWYGPYLSFLPGSYVLTISVSGSTPAVAGADILYVNANGYGAPFYYAGPLNSTAMPGGGWSYVRFYVNITEPYFLTEFRGYLIYNGDLPAGTVYLNYISLHRLS